MQLCYPSVLSKAIWAKKNCGIIGIKRLHSWSKESKCYSNCALVDKAKIMYASINSRLSSFEMPKV